MLVQTLALFSTLSFSFAQGTALRRRQAGGRIVWDGRVAQSAVVADFDAPNGAFDPEFVKGQNVSFSEMILFPNNKSSLLDASVSAKTLEVTINDNSIFAPGGSNPQTAVRRTELMPNPSLNSTAGNSTTTGIKTLHFSLRPSCARPLNTSHEYLLVFLERGDFSANQISFKTGTLLGSDGASKDELVLLGNSAAGSEQLFSTPLVAGEFVNVALKMDFDANTVQVFQSTGLNPLTQQTEPLPNDLSGNGAFHFGVNKNPTDPGEDVLRSGFQEADILEGVEYGGLFIEDSIDGDIILV